MLSTIGKAIAQLNDRAIHKTLVLSVATAVAIFALIWTVVGYLLRSTAFFAWGSLETVVDLTGGLVTLFLTWFLFPGVVSVATGFFLDDVAAAVEARHYPALAPAAGQTTSTSVAHALRFLAVLMAANLLLLPSLMLGPVFPLVFYAVNGYLLGREYFDLVAMRRMDAVGTGILRKRRRSSLFFVGVAIAFMLTIPVVNLLAPIIATAIMIHLFENWRRATHGIVST